MGWSNNVLTYPFTKIGANGNGDFQQMVESSKTTEIELFKHGTWNKWAKFKYFKDTQARVSIPVTSYAAARKAADQGFVNFAFTNDTLSCYNRAAATAADWEYNRPLGSMTDAQVAAYYPLRTWDFLNDTDKTSTSTAGYNKLAKRPFEISVPSPVSDLSTPSGYADYQIMWQYSAQQISLTDLISFGDSYSNWNWVVLLKMPGASSSSAPTLLYLKTAKGGSTNVAVSAPSSQYPTLVGYFRLNLNALSSGKVTAFLAIENSNIPHKYIYIPTGSVNPDYPGMSFEIFNPAADIMFNWVWNASQSGQPSGDIRYGIDSHMTINPSGTRLQSYWLTRIKAVIPSGVTTNTRVYVRVGVKGSYDSQATYSEVYVTKTSSGEQTFFVDNRIPASTTASMMETDTFDNMMVSIRITIGTQIPFYLDPRQPGNESGKMGKLLYEEFVSIRDIRAFMGANAGNFIYTNIEHL